MCDKQAIPFDTVEYFLLYRCTVKLLLCVGFFLWSPWLLCSPTFNFPSSASIFLWSFLGSVGSNLYFISLNVCIQLETFLEWQERFQE